MHFIMPPPSCGIEIPSDYVAPTTTPDVEKNCVLSKSDLEALAQQEAEALGALYGDDHAIVVGDILILHVPPKFEGAGFDVKRPHRELVDSGAPTPQRGAARGGTSATPHLRGVWSWLYCGSVEVLPDFVVEISLQSLGVLAVSRATSRTSSRAGTPKTPKNGDSSNDSTSEKLFDQAAARSGSTETNDQAKEAGSSAIAPRSSGPPEEDKTTASVTLSCPFLLNHERKLLAETFLDVQSADFSLTSACMALECGWQAVLELEQQKLMAAMARASQESLGEEDNLEAGALTATRELERLLGLKPLRLERKADKKFGEKRRLPSVPEEPVQEGVNEGKGVTGSPAKKRQRRRRDGRDMPSQGQGTTRSGASEPIKAIQAHEKLSPDSVDINTYTPATGAGSPAPSEEGQDERGHHHQHTGRHSRTQQERTSRDKAGFIHRKNSEDSHRSEGPSPRSITAGRTEDERLVKEQSPPTGASSSSKSKKRSKPKPWWRERKDRSVGVGTTTRTDNVKQSSSSSEQCGAAPGAADHVEGSHAGMSKAARHVEGSHAAVPNVPTDADDVSSSSGQFFVKVLSKDDALSLLQNCRKQLDFRRRKEGHICLLCCEKKPGSLFVPTCLTVCGHWRSCVECLWEVVRCNLEEKRDIGGIVCPECEGRALIDLEIKGILAAVDELDETAHAGPLYELWERLSLHAGLEEGGGDSSKRERVAYCPGCETQRNRAVPCLYSSPLGGSWGSICVCEVCEAVFCGICLDPAHHDKNCSPTALAWRSGGRWSETDASKKIFSITVRRKGSTMPSAATRINAASSAPTNTATTAPTLPLHSKNVRSTLSSHAGEKVLDSTLSCPCCLYDAKKKKSTSAGTLVRPTHGGTSVLLQRTDNPPFTRNGNSVCCPKCRITFCLHCERIIEGMSHFTLGDCPLFDVQQVEDYLGSLNDPGADEIERDAGGTAPQEPSRPVPTTSPITAGAVPIAVVERRNGFPATNSQQSVVDKQEKTMRSGASKQGYRALTAHRVLREEKRLERRSAMEAQNTAVKVAREELKELELLEADNEDG